MITNDEISFMKDIGINVNFESPSYEDLDLMEDEVSAYLEINGFDDNYDINDIGRFCEGIIDKVT